MAAVPFDVASNSNTASYSHAGTSNATVAVVLIKTNGTSPTVTYGGVSMTLVRSDIALGGGDNYYSFYLKAPPTGSQTVTATITGATSQILYTATYTGGPYATAADCSAGAFKVNGVGTTLNVPLVTTSNNVIGVSIATNGGVAFVVASGMTFRSSFNIANKIEDSTDLIATPTTFNMAWDNNGNTTNIEAIAIGIGLAPASNGNMMMLFLRSLLVLLVPTAVSVALRLSLFKFYVRRLYEGTLNYPYVGKGA